MATGKKIVCSDIGSMREIVSENEVFFFEPDDTESLRDALALALSSDSSRGVRALKKFKENYKWSQRASKVLNEFSNFD